MEYGKQQKSVAEVVWPWRSGSAASGLKKPMDPKLKAVIQSGVMALIALFLWLVLEHRIMPVIVLALAGLVLIGGLFVPPLFQAIERFGQLLGKGVAVGLTWGLLVPFYYLCFVPSRIILTLRGKDPMHREFPTSQPTYWIPRPPVRSLDQYRKQH